MRARQQPTAETLFAAARRDAPTAELKQRTLAGMRELARERPVRVGGLAIATPLLLAAAALTVLWLVKSPAQDPSSIVAEPIPTGSHAAAAPPVSAAISAPALPVVASIPPASPRPPPKRVPPPSLSQEVTSLEGVQGALDAGHPEQALRLLDVYRRSGAGRLRAEAELLRIEALNQSGETQRASQLAKDFVARHPGNPLVDRARAFAGSSAE
jgi:hypothetical protein